MVIRFILNLIKQIFCVNEILIMTVWLFIEKKKTAPLICHANIKIDKVTPKIIKKILFFSLKINK